MPPIYATLLPPYSVKTNLTTLAAETKLADTDITAAVDRLFRQKKGVAAAFIGVTCFEGMVELTGFTESLLSRERAADITKEVRGVRGVINEISIRTPDVPDAELRSRVELALLQDLAAGDYPVRCHAQDGEISVEGIVQSWAEEQLVLRVLRGVPGVRRIHNFLMVRGGGLANSDAEITNQIQEFLAWDIRVKSTLVDISTTDGVVHLAGTVGSAAEHDHVVATAYIAGATAVDTSELMVAYWVLDKELKRQKFAPKADENVAQAVRDVLCFDPRVRAFAPMVRVSEGIVTLLGMVSNLRARQCAEQDARNVVGVIDVFNLLQVRVLHPLADEEIREHMLTALAADAYVSRYRFTAQVSTGAVELHGTVDTHFDQEHAAAIVAGINGVVALTNCIQVLPTADYSLPTADAGLLASPHAVVDAVSSGPDSHPAIASDYLLEQCLRTGYHWSAPLHDQEIIFQVHHGRVTLTGTVDTWLDHKTATAEAYACGAHDVDNKLQLAGI